MRITLKTTGKSIKELLEEYGTGSKGFYVQKWYKNEPFFTERPDAGEYEILIDRSSVSKTYKEQVSEIPEGYIPVHPAIVIEALLSHYKKTGEKILEDWCVRTSSLYSGGHRVYVGYFDPDGLLVDYWGDNRNDTLGLSCAKRLSSSIGTKETVLPDIIELNGVKYKKI